MAMLESAMAFAVAMMIFSTIVTGIVEAILKVLGTREKNLQKTVEALFHKVVWPRFEAGLDRVRPSETAGSGESLLSKGMSFLSRRSHSSEAVHQAKFVKDLTENPVFKQEKRTLTGWLSNSNKPRIDSLSLLSFAERLGKSDVGKAIVAEGEAQMDLLVRDLVRGFDRFGRAASEVFRKKAQLTAICVAIPLALIANIDAARLLTQMIENPEIRSGLIEQADDAKKANEAAVASLNALHEALAQQPDSSADGADDAAGEDQLAELQNQLVAASDNVRESVKKLEAEGLSIGWSYYPFCAEGHNDVKCGGRVGLEDKDGKPVGWRKIVGTADFGTWFLMATLAGVLIGLGGPFWFKVFTGLAQVFQVMRALGIGGRKPAEGAEPAPAEAAEDSAKPKTVIDAFKVAVAVNIDTTPIHRGRAILSPDGQLLKPAT